MRIINKGNRLTFQFGGEVLPNIEPAIEFQLVGGGIQFAPATCPSFAGESGPEVFQQYVKDLNAGLAFWNFIKANPDAVLYFEAIRLLGEFPAPEEPETTYCPECRTTFRWSPLNGNSSGCPTCDAINARED